MSSPVEIIKHIDQDHFRVKFYFETVNLVSNNIKTIYLISLSWVDSLSNFSDGESTSAINNFKFVSENKVYNSAWVLAWNNDAQIKCTWGNITYNEYENSYMCLLAWEEVECWARANYQQ